MSVMRMLKNGVLNCTMDPTHTALRNRTVLPSCGCWVLVLYLNAQKNFPGISAKL